MASGKSNYLKGALVNGVLGGPQYTLPATVYIALSTSVWSASKSSSALDEPSGGAYTRVAMTNNSTNWPAGSPKSNGIVITFPTASGAWGTATSFYILDAGSAGNVLYGGDLTTPRVIGTGDTGSFAVGALIVTEA